MELLGKFVSDKIKNEVNCKIEKLKEKPVLAILRVGDEKDQISYEKNAIKKMDSFGIETNSYILPKDINFEDFKNAFDKLNNNEKINGILVLQPLPDKKFADYIAKNIDVYKDIDGMSPFNMNKIMREDDSGFATCTAQAVIEILKAYNIDIDGKRAVVVNNSLVVGKSLSMLLLKEDATVTICHSHTKDLKEITKTADILVTGIGKAKFFDDTYIKEGAVVIDVGINFDEDGKLCGDCNYESMVDKAYAITPVPGGVGVVTTAVLGKHLIKNI